VSSPGITYRIHRFVGLVAGVYVCLICLTGAALVFRIDLQRAMHPHLLTAPAAEPLADPVAIMDSVARAYPEHRLSGVEAPTTQRATYLAYVTKGSQFVTVLIDPVTTRVLGELPERTAITTLQELHFRLLAGVTGKVISAVGAASLLILCVSGLVTWLRGGPRTGAREWHRRLGIVSLIFSALWALTGLYFLYPSQARAAINRISSITVSRPPPSDPSAAAAPRPSWRDVIDRARSRASGLHVARVVTPFGDRGAWLVMFAAASPTPAGTMLQSVYVDQYSGAVLDQAEGRPTIGDTMVKWIVPLHIGSFGGTATRILWSLLALLPPILFVTGTYLWLRRRT
jgi:uncharacterized iron-regulated membrane protein